MMDRNTVVFLILLRSAAGCGGAQPPAVATSAPSDAAPAPAAAAPEEASPPSAPPPSGEPAPVADSPDAPRDVEGANFKQANYTAGKKIYLNDISCKTGGAAKLDGLAGLDAVASGFESKHADFKGCIGQRVKTRVRWTVADSKMIKVKASGADAKSQSCIEAALQNAPTKSPNAECAVTVWHD